MTNPRRCTCCNRAEEFRENRQALQGIGDTGTPRFLEELCYCLAGVRTHHLCQTPPKLSKTTKLHPKVDNRSHLPRVRPHLNESFLFADCRMNNDHCYHDRYFSKGTSVLIRFFHIFVHETTSMHARNKATILLSLLASRSPESPTIDACRTTRTPRLGPLPRISGSTCRGEQDTPCRSTSWYAS